MKLLRRRPIADARELAACAAACLPGFFPGLRVADSPPAVAEAMADIVAVDGVGGLVLLVCEPQAGPAPVLRALECAAWWQQHRALIPRLVPGAREDLPPRAVVVAGRFPEDALRVLRALGATAPTAIECRLYDDGDAGGAAFEVVFTPVEAGEVRPAGEANGARSAEAPGRAGGDEVGERLARLRFREAFR